MNSDMAPERAAYIYTSIAREKNISGAAMLSGIQALRGVDISQGIDAMMKLQGSDATADELHAIAGALGYLGFEQRLSERGSDPDDLEDFLRGNPQEAAAVGQAANLMSAAAAEKALSEELPPAERRKWGQKAVTLLLTAATAMSVGGLGAAITYNMRPIVKDAFERAAAERPDEMAKWMDCAAAGAFAQAAVGEVGISLAVATACATDVGIFNSTKIKEAARVAAKELFMIKMGDQVGNAAALAAEGKYVTAAAAMSDRSAMAKAGTAFAEELGGPAMALFADLVKHRNTYAKGVGETMSFFNNLGEFAQTCAENAPKAMVAYNALQTSLPYTGPVFMAAAAAGAAKGAVVLGEMAAEHVAAEVSSAAEGFINEELAIVGDLTYPEYMARVEEVAKIRLAEEAVMAEMLEQATPGPEPLSYMGYGF